MTEKRYKRLLEKAKLKGKKLLIEDTFIEGSKLDIDYYKDGDSKLLESSNGKSFEALAVVRNFPITKFDVINKNGRIYPKSEFTKESVMREAEGSYAFCNHQDDPDMDTVWGIWHNYRVEEDSVYSDLYLIEEKPVRILKAGGSLGSSTVGFGNLDDEGKVYDYELEEKHLADIVFNPSQGTYSSFAENKVEIQESEKNNKNSAIKNITNIKENITNNIKTEVNSSMDNIQKAFLTNQVKLELREASKTSDYADSIVKLNSLEIPIEMKDLKEKVENKVQELQDKLQESAEKKENSLNDAQKELEMLKESHAEISRRYRTLKRVLESSKSNDKETQELLEDNQILYKEIKKLIKEKEMLLKNQGSSIVSRDRKLIERDLTKLLEKQKAMKKEMSLLEKTVKIKSDNEKNMLSDIRYLEHTLEKLKRGKKKIRVWEEEEEEMEDFEEFEDSVLEDDEFVDETEEPESAELETVVGDVRVSVEVEQLDDDELEEESIEEFDYDEYEEENEEEEEIKESIRVRNYYMKELKRTPALKDARKSILASKSLKEAMAKVKKFKFLRSSKRGGLKESVRAVATKRNFSLVSSMKRAGRI